MRQRCCQRRTPARSITSHQSSLWVFHPLRSKVSYFLHNQIWNIHFDVFVTVGLFYILWPDMEGHAIKCFKRHNQWFHNKSKLRRSMRQFKARTLTTKRTGRGGGRGKECIRNCITRMRATRKRTVRWRTMGSSTEEFRKNTVLTLKWACAACAETASALNYCYPSHCLPQYNNLDTYYEV